VVEPLINLWCHLSFTYGVKDQTTRPSWAQLGLSSRGNPPQLSGTFSKPSHGHGTEEEGIFAKNLRDLHWGYPGETFTEVDENHLKLVSDCLW
jgi:hypothetical protein